MGNTSNDGQGTLMELLQFLDTVGPDVLLSTPDAVYELLKNEQRRHLVLFLSEQETATPISLLATNVASRSQGIPMTDVTQSEQEWVRIRLEQEHLPRLADYGILSWTYGEDMVDPIPSVLPSDEE
ncbi:MULTISPECIES: hypothetical protein [unclassified Haladaptatus]|uniref:DUF7344 domain-containing protein n=1 Tax=unclassified Haladaptatus TaxID=2622732 RepID=UPI00209BF47D|nr:MULTISPECIES: hypothetical protein [unclassified Haladaptatus]MCO8246591.1 hypothetical protein [Haladaptatus sp. AB643]MCO8256288.1 hypothetical protein [Haladaptatus sp. AB618]